MITSEFPAWAACIKAASTVNATKRRIYFMRCFYKTTGAGSISFCCNSGALLLTGSRFRYRLGGWLGCRLHDCWLLRTDFPQASCTTVCFRRPRRFGNRWHHLNGGLRFGGFRRFNGGQQPRLARFTRRFVFQPFRRERQIERSVLKLDHMSFGNHASEGRRPARP